MAIGKTETAPPQISHEDYQIIFRHGWNAALEEAAKLADEYSTYYTIKERVLALKEKT